MQGATEVNANDNIYLIITDKTLENEKSKKKETQQRDRNQWSDSSILQMKEPQTKVTQQSIKYSFFTSLIPNSNLADIPEVTEHIWLVIDNINGQLMRR